MTVGSVLVTGLDQPIATVLSRATYGSDAVEAFLAARSG